MRAELPVAAVLGVVWLVRRGRKRRRRADDDSSSVDGSIGSSFTEASVTADIQGTARRPPGLSTVHEEDHEEESTRRHRRRRRSKYLSWDQILVIVCLVATLALGYQRQAWDVVALLGVLLFITLLAPFVRSLRRRRRKASRASEDEEDAALGGTAASVAALPAVATRPDPRLVGVWVKDGKASDPMHTACDMMSLNGIVRVAISMVKGVEIHFKDVPTDTALGAPASEASSAPAGTSATLMEFAVFSVVSWFKVRERYVLNGPSAQFNRRDLRRGKHTAKATVLPDGAIRVDIEWGQPHAGSGHDEFRLESDNELHVTSHLSVGSRRHTYTIVYRRKK